MYRVELSAQHLAAGLINITFEIWNTWPQAFFSPRLLFRPGEYITIMNYAMCPSAITECSSAWWNWGLRIIGLHLMETDCEPGGPSYYRPESPKGGVGSENLVKDNDICQR